MNNLNIFDKNTSINFEDLYNHQGLLKIDNLFFSFLQEQTRRRGDVVSSLPTYPPRSPQLIISAMLSVLSSSIRRKTGRVARLDAFRCVSDSSAPLDPSKARIESMNMEYIIIYFYPALHHSACIITLIG